MTDLEEKAAVLGNAIVEFLSVREDERENRDERDVEMALPWLKCRMAYIECGKQSGFW